MEFGKRIRPPDVQPAEPDAATVEGANVIAFRPKGAPATAEGASKERLVEAAREFMQALMAAFDAPTSHGLHSVHLNTVVGVTAAVLGQMATRKVFSDDALDSMPPLLPPGVADGPIYADVGLGEETLYHWMLAPAKNRVARDRLPNPYAVAQRLLKSTGLSVPPAHLPHVNSLKVMPHYDLIALAIAARAGFNRKDAMRMTAGCLLLFLANEKDDETLAILIRLALEVTLLASRLNPRKRD